MTCNIVGGNRDLVAFEICPSEGIILRAQCKGEDVHHLIVCLIRRDTVGVSALLELDIAPVMDGSFSARGAHFRVGTIYLNEAILNGVIDATLLAILRHRCTGTRSDETPRVAQLRWGDE